MHTMRTQIGQLALCLAMAACGSSGQGPASADAVAAKDALQDVVDAADVPGDAKDTDTNLDTSLPDTPGGDADAEPADGPDAVPDTPPAETTKPIPDALPWIDTNLTEPSDDCDGDAVYPPDGTTLLLDVGPLLPANVVTGCGKGPPQPVSFGNECCDCPPPYSCYCNGECGWLRGPDLKVPQSGGKAVWTGKWVVSVRVKSAIVSGQSEYTLEGQRWNPSGGGGWESIPLPSTEIVNNSFDMATTGGKVYIKAFDKAFATIALAYDPDANVIKKWKSYSWLQNNEMAVVGDNVVEIGPATKDDWLQGALWFYDPAADSWTQAPLPISLLPVDGKLTQGVLLGDSNAAYLYDCAVNTKSNDNPFPDGTFALEVGHILKFDLATSTWTDIGLVPKGWRQGDLQTANLRPDGAILVSREVADVGSQFARFFAGKWDFGTPGPIWQLSNRLQSIDVPCGAVLGSAAFVFGTGQNEVMYRVQLVRDNLSVEFPSVWGQPVENGEGLFHTQVVATGDTVLVIGGHNDAVHRAVYRFPVPELCK